MTEARKLLEQFIAAGGSVSPSSVPNEDGGTIHFAGLSLRDYFAAQALIAILTNHDHYNSNLVTAGQAYQMADAMLRARAQGEG